MSLETDIRKVTRFYLSTGKNKKTGNPHVVEESVDKFSQELISQYKKHKINFSKTDSFYLKRKQASGTIKKRLIKNMSHQEEDILSICVKRILDRSFHIKFPNRNSICGLIFNLMPAVIQMTDFSIIRFDFKDYFNSINNRYVFEKFIKSEILHGDELDLIKLYVSQIDIAYAGLRPSNSIAEIAATYFDNELKSLLNQYGLIFYERYIDDGLIILNQHISENEIKSLLLQTIKKIFNDRDIENEFELRNKVCLNEKKFDYISCRDVKQKDGDFSFLGYSFHLFKKESRIGIKYGITKEKQVKYLNRLKKLILLCYKENKNVDEYLNYRLLEHRIRCFVTRQVYTLRNLKSYTWKSKGFIANYKELRYIVDTELIDESTRDFLANIVKQAFEELQITPPHYVNKYSLLVNLKKNRTLVFVPGIGYDLKSLRAMCQKVGLKSKNYDALVRDYLIKMKVGY